MKKLVRKLLKMVQNRNRLLKLVIGNLSNCVVHMVLERNIDNENIRKHYSREYNNSIEIAKKYRNKINPVNYCLREVEIKEISIS